MKLKLLFGLLLIGLTANAATTSVQVLFRLKPQYHVIEQKAGIQLPASVEQLHSSYALTALKKVEMGKSSQQYFYVASFSESASLEILLKAYQQCSEVLYAESDAVGTHGGVQAVVPNDAFYFRQWSLKNDGSFALSPATAGADIDMENAWSIEQGDTSVIVGVIDSGCKLDHPEFAGRIWINYAEIPNNNIDDDGDGLVDDVKGWDYVNNDNDPTDDEGHGTNVAGIIGASGNNSIGYAGMDWNCKLMILKGIDNTGSGFYSWWTSAIYYAVDHGCKVINMSLGGQSFSSTMQSAVDYALNNDVLVVACMMNTNVSTPYYPAAYTSVMAVGATNPNDTRANPFFWSTTSGSNYGSHISVVAPGNYIYSLNHLSNTNFNTYWGGTSQAAPHTAGLAALLLAQDSTRSALQLRTIIETTAEDQVGLASEDVAGWDQYFGFGRINAQLALSFTTNIATPTASSGINFYPNPCVNQLTVDVPAGQSCTVRFYDTSGRLVSTRTNIQQSERLAIDFASGVYIAVVEMGNQVSYQKISVR